MGAHSGLLVAVGVHSVSLVADADAVGTPPVLVTMSSGVMGVLSVLLVEYCSSESSRLRSRRVAAYMVTALTCVAFLFSFSWWSVTVFLAHVLSARLRACDHAGDYYLLAEVNEVIPT